MVSLENDAVGITTKNEEDVCLECATYDDIKERKCILTADDVVYCDRCKQKM